MELDIAFSILLVWFWNILIWSNLSDMFHLKLALILMFVISKYSGLQPKAQEKLLSKHVICRWFRSWLETWAAWEGPEKFKYLSFEELFVKSYLERSSQGWEIFLWNIHRWWFHEKEKDRAWPCCAVEARGQLQSSYIWLLEAATLA